MKLGELSSAGNYNFRKIVKWAWFTVYVLRQTFHSISTNHAGLIRARRLYISKVVISCCAVFLFKCFLVFKCVVGYTFQKLSFHVMQFCSASLRAGNVLVRRPKERKTKLKGPEFSRHSLRNMMELREKCTGTKLLLCISLLTKHNDLLFQ